MMPAGGEAGHWTGTMEVLPERLKQQQCI